MLPGAQGRVLNIIEVEVTRWSVPNDVFDDFVYHDYSIRLFSDRLVFEASTDPSRKTGGFREHDRAGYYFAFAGLRVGFDASRPGVNKRVPQSVFPWRPETDEQELEVMIWAVRDEAQRLASLLARKPPELSLRDVIDRA